LLNNYNNEIIIKLNENYRKIALLPNGYNDGHEDYVSLYLGNHDVEKKDHLNVYGSFVFSMRNCDDYSNYRLESNFYFN